MRKKYNRHQYSTYNFFLRNFVKILTQRILLKFAKASKKIYIGDDQGRQFGKQRNLLNFQNFAWLRVNREFPKFVSAFMKIAKFVHLLFTLLQKLFNIWNKAPDFNEIIVLA